MLPKSFKHTKEAKRKIAIAMKNRKVSEETRKKMSASMLGNTNGFKKGEEKLPFSKNHLKKLSINWFKKGDDPWNLGKKVEAMQNEKHPNWKGENVSYVALHTWVARYLGKPCICEFCGRNGLKGKQIHWANKSREYKRDLEDWLRLCVPCHKKYDLANNRELVLA